MAKEEKPLEYQHRILDTKGVVQRVDLEYLNKPAFFRDFRRKLAWIAPLAAAAGILPFVVGLGGEDVFVNGPVSRAHAMIGENCSACHTEKFTSVANAACLKCHDGPSHPAKAVDTATLIGEPRCAQCHLEHRGQVLLAEVADGNCTTCHKDLSSRGEGVKLKAASITSFRENRHPELSAHGRPDRRPLKLNHYKHVVEKSKTRGGKATPVKCSACHVPRLDSPKGDFMPVTFEQHCRECHKEQLEFDVYNVLGGSNPAPHTKDTQKIHQYVVETYQKALAANPDLLRQPLRGMLDPISNAAAWQEKVIRDSEGFLFGTGKERCFKCHELEGSRDGYPVVRPVQRIEGRYVEGQAQAEPWLVRGEFSHRAHRAVTCESCHTGARDSKESAQVLIPKLVSCAQCHGASGTHLDRCAQCHLYHNKMQEKDKDRRPIEQLLGVLHRTGRFLTN